MSYQTCAAGGCGVSCVHLMCTRHWYMVPPRIRLRLWRHHDEDSKEWSAAVDAAVDAVALRERQLVEKRKRA